MKIFSVRRIIGLAAIAGTVMYVRKHGGIRNAFDHLMRTINNVLRPPDADSRKTATESRTASERTNYTDVGDYSRH